MNSKIIKLGDILTLTSHAYVGELTSIVISGEPSFLPPLFVVTEIFSITSKNEEPETFEYKCLWYSNKMHSFEHVKLKDIYVKKIDVENTVLSTDVVLPGTMVTLATMDYELSKRKSSFSSEDNTLNNDISNTTISALLSHLCPILHVINVSSHKSKHPKTKTETDNPEIMVASNDVMCFYYNSAKDKFSEIILPIEALRLIIPVNEKIILLINEIIISSGCLRITIDEQHFLVKPKLITYRSGYYFLRGYDYVLNRMLETSITDNNQYEKVENFILSSAPSFDLEKNPNSVSKTAAASEIESKLLIAISNKNYIRIKYRNRHDISSIRTLKDYKILVGSEDGKEYNYIHGFCCLRMAIRVFRIDRVESFEELNLSF